MHVVGYELRLGKRMSEKDEEKTLSVMVLLLVMTVEG
jgi:hypothetical protein